MNRTLLKAGAICFTVLIVPWAMFESIGLEKSVVLPVRWGLAIGLLSLPLYFALYWFSFQGPFYWALLGVAGSFVTKAVILSGAGWILYVMFGFSPYYSLPALFFSLFSVSFIAIYLVFSLLPENGKENG